MAIRSISVFVLFELFAAACAAIGAQVTNGRAPSEANKILPLVFTLYLPPNYIYICLLRILISHQRISWSALGILSEYF